MTLMIGKWAGKLLLKLGKAGVSKLLTESLLHKAATDTQLDFEELLEIREALVTWSATEDMAAVLEDLKDGKRNHMDNLVSRFVDVTGFYDDESTNDRAKAVLDGFLGHVVDELESSPSGLVYVANRMEASTAETQVHVTTEADRIIEEVSSISSSRENDRVKEEFDYQTEVAQKNIRVEIAGITGPLERPEVSLLESQFRLEVPVILNGEPGTGKTGVALMISRNGSAVGKQILYIDARRVQDVQNETELRRFYSVNEPFIRAIERLSEKGFRLIIDQFDNVANRKVGNVLVELATQCMEIPGVEVLVVSRTREGHESELVRRLTDQGFVPITCRSLTAEQSSQLLNELGIAGPTDELVEMCRNLLNLDIVATIKKEQPAFDFTDILNEVVLWDSYLETLVKRESQNSTRAAAEEILNEAMGLSKFALQSGQQAFVIDNVTDAHRRLVSWGIITNVEVNVYQFGHEILQDFLCARYCADRGMKVKQVLSEVNALKSKSVIAWMERIYSARNSTQLVGFLEEVLNG